MVILLNSLNMQKIALLKEEERQKAKISDQQSSMKSVQLNLRLQLW